MRKGLRTFRSFTKGDGRLSDAVPALYLPLPVSGSALVGSDGMVACCMLRLDLPAVTRLGRGILLTLSPVNLLKSPMKFLLLFLTPLLCELASNDGATLVLFHSMFSVVVPGLPLPLITRVLGTATLLELDIDMHATTVPNVGRLEMTPSPILSACNAPA